MSDSTSTIEEEKLVSIIGGTIEDLKEYVEEQNPDSKLLNRLLEDEKAAKDRKTAKEYLRKKLKEQKVGGDFRKARKELEDVQNTLEHIKRQEIGARDFSKEETEDIDSVKEIGLLEGDFEDVKEFVNDRNPSVEKTRELIEGEKKAQDRKKVKSLLRTFIRQKKLYKDINNAEYHIGKVKEDFAEIEEESEYISPDLLDTHEPHDAVEEKVDEASESEVSKGENEESNGDPVDEDTEGKSSEQKKEQDDVVEEETEQEDNSELEEKKALLEDLDVDMSDEKLREIDKSQLEALKDEKSEREKLIDDLKEIGMDEDELRSSSTKDLKTLKEELDGSEDTEASDDPGESSEDDSGKDEQELEEEAEEDLEMLMGSVKDSGSEDEGRDTLDQLKDMKQQFKDLWNTPEKEDEEETGIDADKVVDLLDHYEERPGKEQAIKTAHVMKGFLEYRMDIDREMTYEELAETLDEVEKASDDIEVLQKFFERMSEDEYTDQIQVDNMDQVIASSKVVIEELS